MQGIIQDWHDGDIIAGTEWRGIIQKRLDTAQIILLLISADFMASDYAYSVEMQRALERHERGEARVIPILLRPTYYRGSFFEDLPFLPSNGQPVTKWRDKDEAFQDIITGIRRAFRDLLENSFTPSSEIVTGDSLANRLPPPTVLHRLSNVFVKSGFPDVTYVEREDFFLLKLALEQPGRGIVIEGR